MWTTYWTRLILLEYHEYIIKIKLLTEPLQNQVTLIPRMDMVPSNSRFPIKFSRRQFPIKLAYAITINKAQGQSLKRVRIYLDKPMFSHGQLYVAFSLAEDPGNLKKNLEDKNKLELFLLLISREYIQEILSLNMS